MAHTTTIHNKSNHEQEFEIHGYNGNRNQKVSANGDFKFQTPDGTSGAVITLHEGHEGEQVEITKHGYMGMSCHASRYTKVHRS